MRYPTQQKQFQLAGKPVSLCIVKDPDSLLDGEIKGDKLPYWAELWPSALALSSHIAGMSFRGETVLELGCGMGLTTVAISLAGGRPLAIDYDPDALRFARHNLESNGGKGLFARMDWNALAVGCAFSYIIGADILYERAELPKLASLFQRYLANGGQVIVAEPGRELAKVFFQSLARYQLEVVRKIETRIDRVTIWHLTKAGTGRH